MIRNSVWPRPDASNYRILDEIRSRHVTVIDGEAMDDKRVKFLSKRASSRKNTLVKSWD